MGLDIIAYRKIKPVENPILDKNGYVEDYQNNWKPGESMDWSESIWPGRGEGVNSQTVYSWEDSFRFRAGSYSGYGVWRHELMNFAHGIAFIELIEFADNEGVIGSVVSKKLLKDFRDHRIDAKRYSENLGINGSYWLEMYDNWMKAFEFASDDGAVNFC